MTGLAIGCDLSAPGTAPEATVPPPPPPLMGEITAILTPAVSRLYAGQSVSDMADYATMVAAGNFVSNLGAIASVDVTPSGDATTLAGALSEGQGAGFTVTVTDDATPPTVQVFTTGLQVVEPRAEVLSVSGNLAEIQINDLLPDGELLDIVITGTPAYDGNYAVTAGTLRAGPYAFPGTARLSHGGLAEGDSVTHDDGLWASPTGALTLTRQARADGIDIPGATGFAHVLTTAELGTEYTLAVTGDDGVNTPVTIVTAALAIPLTGEITALLVPAVSRLYAGQSVSDMADYATMVAAGNFVSNLGAIASVDVTPSGDATTLAGTLSEGQGAGFTVTVTDDATPPTVQVFTTGLQVVEYDVRILETMGNEAEIDINSLVPDTETLTIAITGGTPYDGTYTPTAGDLRNGAYNFAGTAAVTHAGPVSGLEVGSTMIHDDGLWATPTGMLTITRQAQADGVNISGATGASHVLTATELGAAYTLEVTGDDGANSPVTVETVPIAIPGPGGLVVTQVAEDALTLTNSSPVTAVVDTGPPEAGKALFVIAAYGKASSLSNAIGVTLEGSAATELVHTFSSNGCNVAVHRVDAAAGGTRTLEITTVDGVAWRGVSYQVFTATGHVAETLRSDQNESFATMDLSAPVTAGAQVLGAAAMVNRGAESNFAYDGLTQTAAYDSQGSKAHGFMSATVDTSETRTMTVTPTGSGSGDVAAAIIILS